MADEARGSKGAAEPKAPGKLRWLIGWVLVPVGFVATLFLSGVHVGARHPDMWMSRAVLWMFDAEAQASPAGPPVPLARRLRLAALPSTGHSLEVDLDAAELAALVEQGFGPSADALDCAKVCEAQWRASHPDREFIAAERCSLTLTEPETPEKPDKTGAPEAPAKPGATLDCEARVQRGKPAS